MLFCAADMVRWTKIGDLMCRMGRCGYWLEGPMVIRASVEQRTKQRGAGEKKKKKKQIKERKRKGFLLQ